MAGEDYAALDFALGLSDGDDIMRCLFGEEGVEHLFVEQELHDCEYQRERAENQRYDAHAEEEEDYRGDHHYAVREYPAEERAGMHVKGLDFNLVARAVELGSHELLSLMLLLAAGGSGADILADLFDSANREIRHLSERGRIVFDTVLSFHDKTPFVF